MSPLRILCFGASLVEGFTNGGLRYTPYAWTMKEKLERHWNDDGIGGSKEEKGKKREVIVAVDGRSGELVTKRFERRMLERFPDPKAQPYDLVLLLGGTNDLGHGISPSKIFSSLQKVSSIALSHGAKVVIFTIPECFSPSEGFSELDRRREEINGCIRRWPGEREGVYVFDLHKKIPYKSLSEEERDEIWDDGLHFTQKGYRRMGSLVAERVSEIVDRFEGAGT